MAVRRLEFLSFSVVLPSDCIHFPSEKTGIVGVKRERESQSVIIEKEKKRIFLFHDLKVGEEREKMKEEKERTC
jgi:hypothetical protein